MEVEIIELDTPESSNPPTLPGQEKNPETAEVVVDLVDISTDSAPKQTPRKICPLFLPRQPKSKQSSTNVESKEKNKKKDIVVGIEFLIHSRSHLKQSLRRKR